MTYAAALLGLGALGAVVGLVLRARLTRADYRLPEEAALPRRPLTWVPVVSAAATPLVWVALSPGRPATVPAGYVVATWVMVVLAAIDLDVHRLPDAIQLPAYPGLLVLLAAGSGVTADWGALGRAALAGGALLALFVVLVLLAPAGGMGLGDVKLAGLLGLLLGWLGWGHVIVGTAGTFLLGGVVAVALLVTGRADRGSEFAYGPVMLVSAVLSLVSTPALGAWLTAAGR